MDRATAASLDHWLTTDPRADAPDPVLPGDPEYPTCVCGRWLRREPDETRTETAWAPCPGKGPLTGEGLAFLMGNKEAARLFETREMYDLECYDWLVNHQPHLTMVDAWTIFIRVCRHCSYRNEMTN